MNNRELQELLAREGFRSDYYDLEGGHLPERYVLSSNGASWSVDYSEHGLESDKWVFATESEACEYLLGELRTEPRARIPHE